MREQIRLGIVHVGRALREPEDFAERWRTGAVYYSAWVWGALLATAILGTTTYGMTMGLLGGPGQVFAKGFICTFAAGLAWAIPLPALYVLNSLAGSKLSISTTILATLVTVSWGDSPCWRRFPSTGSLRRPFPIPASYASSIWSSLPASASP